MIFFHLILSSADSDTFKKMSDFFVDVQGNRNRTYDINTIINGYYSNKSNAVRYNASHLTAVVKSFDTYYEKLKTKIIEVAGVLEKQDFLAGCQQCKEPLYHAFRNNAKRKDNSFFLPDVDASELLCFNKNGVNCENDHLKTLLKSSL